VTSGRLDAFALRGEMIDTYRDYVQRFNKIPDPQVADEVDTALTSGDLWSTSRRGHLRPAEERREARR
jgi:hypothetical protein